jgi:outer membrane lipoprotein-sorting protein
MKKVTLIATIVAIATFAFSCEQNGASDNMEDKMKNTGENMKESSENMMENIKDAGEEAKDTISKKF